jgi:thiamine-phosphate pyrophosphorylase
MDKSCELYLRLRADALPAMPELAALVGETAPAAILITGDARRTAGGALHAFMEAAHRLTLAVLIENDVTLAREIGADGVHALDGAGFADARRTLGEEKSIGVSSALSRHDAMSLAEMGADYIAFGEAGAGDRDIEALAEMIGWWDELFEVPCVAWLKGDETDADVRRLVEAGADYLAVGVDAGDTVRLRQIAAIAGGGDDRSG